MRGVPGVINLATHEVNTRDSPPIRSAPYRLPPQWKDQVKTSASRNSQNLCKPWSSPIVFVVKPGVAVHLCVDYRKQNSVAIPDPYYIPLINEILDQVVEAMYLSKLYLSKRFYQVPLDEKAIPKSAFITSFGNLNSYACLLG